MDIAMQIRQNGLQSVIGREYKVLFYIYHSFSITTNTLQESLFYNETSTINDNNLCHSFFIQIPNYFLSEIWLLQT